MESTERRSPGRVRWIGGTGLVLVAVCWPLTWTLPGMRSHILFFPLWLGYILVVEALTLRRGGSSLLAASPHRFALLFAASAPAWWLFEGLNQRLGNWVYLARDELGPVEYFLWATLAFSTVVPAVFATAALVRTFGWIQRFSSGPRIPDTPAVHGLGLALGVAMLSLLLVWPRYFYPFAWLSLIFLLEPLARRLGRRCLLERWRHGDWRLAASLAAGALICGFFWELWNYWAHPKWVYRIPFLGFGRVFEMPILGYLGYLPFGLELYPLTHLLLPASFSRAGASTDSRD